MEIRDDEIRRLESLAALRLDTEEREILRAQLSRILDYVRQLESLDLDAVPPTTHVLPSNQPLRADETRPSLPREQMLGNAPDQRDGHYRVPRFVGEEEKG
jgi:aspartyl-tRNA(Asn)/glutamyl-tRNA(Gln) amidotransferase subunit C